MKKISIILTATLISSCNGKLDQKFVKDSEGNYYITHHKVGQLYFVQEIDIEDFSKLEEE